MRVDAQSLIGPTFMHPATGPDQAAATAENIQRDTPRIEGNEQEKSENENLTRQIETLTENGKYNVNFEFDQETRQLIVRLVDSDNGELIRQLPSEEVLELSKALKELQGNLIDTLS